ncbi:MAG: cysteine--tRNA ligase, partial [Candidatus Thermoplasmatota archaeon]|nr:cysteine--tRNA ligase [Candidatus Thermoplasmatota archaeon]
VVGSVEAYYDLIDELFAIVPPEQAASGIEDDLLDLLLEVREEARSAGEYGIADTIRDALGELAIEVEDTDQGPRWHRT